MLQLKLCVLTCKQSSIVIPWNGPEVDVYLLQLACDNKGARTGQVELKTSGKSELCPVGVKSKLSYRLQQPLSLHRQNWTLSCSIRQVYNSHYKLLQFPLLEIVGGRSQIVVHIVLAVPTKWQLLSFQVYNLYQQWLLY